MTNKICSVEDCGKKHCARGYCAMHYTRVGYWGNPYTNPKVEAGLAAPASRHNLATLDCQHAGCKKKATKFYDSYCLDHFRRRKHLGQPLASVIPVPCSTTGCRFFDVRIGLCRNCLVSKHTKDRMNNIEGYREKFLAKKLAWMRSPSGKRAMRASGNLRRALKLKATPPWINKKDLAAVYARAEDGQTLDHIIPLKNKHICGLHVPWNLQYLTHHENITKNNRFDGTYENNSWRIQYNEDRQKEISNNEQGTEAQDTGLATREEASGQAAP